MLTKTTPQLRLGANAPDAPVATYESPAQAQKLGKLRRASAPGASAWSSCQVSRLKACHADMYITVTASTDGVKSVASPKHRRVHNGVTKIWTSRKQNLSFGNKRIGPESVFVQEA